MPVVIASIGSGGGQPEERADDRTAGHEGLERAEVEIAEEVPVPPTQC